MLFGIAASCHLMKLYSGASTHRRTVFKGRRVVDVHIRVRDSLACTPAFSGDCYLSMLGQELGAMESAAYTELVGVVLDWLDVNVGGDLESQTVLCEFPADEGLYHRLSGCCIYRCLRYMLCKFIKGVNA